MITTIILCGGKGTRLRPLTDLIPKTLVPLKGSPCLEHILRDYIRKGHERFILCTGYRSEAIVDFVKTHSFNADIHFSDGGEHASMLERLYLARPLLVGERFFVTYGDTIIDVDLSAMLESHLASGAKVTLTIAEVISPFGLVKIDKENWIDSFAEKPSQSYYIGHMLMETTVLDELSPHWLKMPDGDGLVALFKDLVARKVIRSHPYRGPKITFNTHEDLNEAQKEIDRFFTYTERGPT